MPAGTTLGMNWLFQIPVGTWRRFHVRKTSIRRYRRWNDVVCLLENLKKCCKKNTINYFFTLRYEKAYGVKKKHSPVTFSYLDHHIDGIESTINRMTGNRKKICFQNTRLYKRKYFLPFYLQLETFFYPNNKSTLACY